MNRKMTAILFFVSLFIMGCSLANQKEEAEDPVTREEVGDVIETEDGRRTVVKTLYDINESQESGPFEITIDNVRISQFQPSKEKISVYGGRDLGLISIKLKVENKSAKTNSIYPNQGLIQTDTGRKVDTHVSLSDQVGGEFQGRTIKEGTVYCFFNGQAENISILSYTIEAGHDEEINSLGEDFVFIFEFD